MDSINGKWIGEYKYGDSYEEDLRGKSVTFYIELFSDGELIRGTCIDEETKEIFTEPAKIEGTFENGVLTFYKSYPNEQTLPSHNQLVAKEYNSTSAQYSGILKKKFLSRKCYFEGTWEINGSFLDEEGTARYYALDGTWKMKKA